MALGIAALALSFTGLVHAQGMATNTNMMATNAPAPTMAPATKPKRHQYTGDITAINAMGGTVIVKKEGAESKTFKIGEKTKYATADKKDAALTDIKVGDKVTVSYTEEDGVLTAHKIGVPASEKKKESKD